MIISHLFKDDSGNWHIQTNEDHCNGVAILASKFAAEFGMANWGRMLGLLHDRGKEGSGFQNYIRFSSGYDQSESCNTEHVHSHVGATIAHKHQLDCLYWLSNAIAGHHRGLYDTDELLTVISQEIPKEADISLPDISLERPRTMPSPAEASHITRMLFSCLVDADRLDTEQFMNTDKANSRPEGDPMEVLKQRLEQHLAGFGTPQSGTLNALRSEVQDICRRNGRCTRGFHALTVPTGGGKTIASIVWGISHALHNGMNRIIVAIPYTSIIVQTAHTLREIFGENNVVEHHSAVKDDCQSESNRLACENWNAPIVVTTNVQLFESMFSNKPSTCRKLHSLCNSIVILDEVQALPMTLLQPIVNAMQSYNKLFGTSFLFCTASQPILHSEHKGLGTAMFHGIDPRSLNNVVSPDMMLHDKLRRVKLKVIDHALELPDLCHRLSAQKRVLCVVNTRRKALEVFRGLDDDGTPSFHLSRMMCPAHILDTILKIKTLLADGEAGIRVISTQLIEAGVDIDFPVVYRQLAGLDSILQAAGRCNREGHELSATTFVFRLNNDRLIGAQGFAADAMKELLSIHHGEEYDWFSPSAMEEYYRALYASTPSFDKHDIDRLLRSPLECRYEEAAIKFRMIDDSGIPVVVNYGEAAALVKELMCNGPSIDLSRKLGRYCVTLRRDLYDTLQEGGLIEHPREGFSYVPLKEQYDNLTGLKTDNEYLEQTMII